MSPKDPFVKRSRQIFHEKVNRSGVNHDFVDGFAMTVNFEAEFSALVTVLGVLIITPKNVSTYGSLLFLGKSPMRVESF